MKRTRTMSRNGSCIGRRTGKEQVVIIRTITRKVYEGKRSGRVFIPTQSHSDAMRRDGWNTQSNTQSELDNARNRILNRNRNRIWITTEIEYYIGIRI